MMQFHDHGYVSTDPRVRPAAGTGIDRPAELPDEVDVLIIGSGPAGMLLAAQMSQFPTISTRIWPRRSSASPSRRSRSDGSASRRWRI